jgi:hypothetical protein
MFLKKAVSLLKLHFFLFPVFTFADLNSYSKSFVIDSTLGEYGSIMDHIEIIIDEEGKISIDDISSDSLLQFHSIDENTILEKDMYTGCVFRYRTI